jgi:spore coat polysaccharide biosynthesis protein SpsF
VTGAVIQARMGSSRLAGKVLADIGGRPMLHYVVARATAATSLERVIVATSHAAADDAIAAWCAAAAVECFRGDEHDVLDRYYQAACRYELSVVVRLTADCPLLDPAVIDHVVGEYFAGEFDYVSNTIVPTYPDGLDVEVVRRSALERAWRDATLASEREHVMPHIWKRPDQFRLKNVTRQPDLSHLRWTVDEPQDLELVRRIYAHFGFATTFDSDRVIQLLATDHGLRALNAGFQRNEGYAKSLQAEQDSPERTRA